jgi:mRNA-degrading endonuclease RelE of RelBE toxin-antitoxin system
VTYSANFLVDLGAIPEDARLEIERIMEEIAEVVSTIPPANPFWASMDDSLLQIDVAGFRVAYRIDPRRSAINVIEVEKRRP